MRMPDTDEPQVALGRAIRKLREDRGMSPQAVAEGADIDVGHLEAIESGEGDIARWNTVAWIARAAGASLADVGALAEDFGKTEEERVTKRFLGEGRGMKISSNSLPIPPVAHLAKCG